MSFTNISRRTFLQASSASAAAAALSPASALGEAGRTFDPEPGKWRTFDVLTTIELRTPRGEARVWIPVPAVNTDWQQSLASTWKGNAQTVRLDDAGADARCAVAQFSAGTPSPTLQITSRVRTRNRNMSRPAGAETAASLRKWVRPTSLAPTDGIVRDTARQITDGTRTDLEKAQRIYDWIIVNTYREPKVRGCGIGDIKALLETGNLGGKCADLNGLFVGLCRASDLPARDAYGVRLAPSAFGYRTLGASSAKLTGAQHCRAEVYVHGHGWLAMDPADVDKVMREETGTWIKDAGDPLVDPVRKALFGHWEGNWMAYNMAADVPLPGSSHGPIGFFMYPQAEDTTGRYDSLDADDFKYSITATEIVA